MGSRLPFTTLHQKLKPFLLGGFTLALILALVSFTAYKMSSNQANQVKGLSTSITPTPINSKLAARLEIYEGTVAVKLPSEQTYKKAKSKMIIPEGSFIKTGSTGRAQIIFPGGTATRLDFNTEIQLKQFSPEPQNILVDIIQGRIWSRIKKLFGNESYRSSSPTMIATVRGTSYGHGVLAGDFNRGLVLKGSVELKCTSSEDALLLEENQKTDASCSQKTGFEAQPLGEIDQIDEWISFNEKQDTLLEERFGDVYFDGDVLGAAISVTPTPGNPSATPNPATTITKPTITSKATYTPKPQISAKKESSSQSSEPNRPAIHSPTYTPNPILTFTPTPTLSPTTTPEAKPIIKVARETTEFLGQLTSLGRTTIVIEGENLQNASIDFSGTTKESITSQSANRIEAKFYNVSCGVHTVTVTNTAGSASQEVRIQALICLQ